MHRNERRVSDVALVIVEVNSLTGSGQILAFDKKFSSYRKIVAGGASVDGTLGTTAKGMFHMKKGPSRIRHNRGSRYLGVLIILQRMRRRHFW